MCGVLCDGFLDNSGTCIAMHACADLHCEMQNRACDTNPTGHCTTCLAGFVEGHDDHGLSVRDHLRHPDLHARLAFAST